MAHKHFALGKIDLIFVAPSNSYRLAMGLHLVDKPGAAAAGVDMRVA